MHFRHKRLVHALHILTRVGELLLSRSDNNRVAKSLEKILEDVWVAVPGPSPMELAVDLLGSLSQVTEQFKKLFSTESDRRVIIAVVK